MESWTSSPWVAFLCILMGLGAWLIGRTIEAFFRGAQTPKDMSRWIGELDFALRDLQGAEIQKALCYRRVADLIGQMPHDFDATAMTGLVMSDQIGRAVLQKAEDMGLYPHGTFESLGVVPYRTPGVGLTTVHEASPEPAFAQQMLPPAMPAETAPESSGNGGSKAVVTPWMGGWVDGRLVPPAAKQDRGN